MRKLRLLLVLSAFAFAGYLLYSSSKPPEAPTMALTGKAAAAQLVKSTISAHKVVVFSKSYVSARDELLGMTLASPCPGC